MKKLIYIVIGLALGLVSCYDSPDKNAEVLAKSNCGSCHLYPNPNLLSKAEWAKVLPNMALRLGIKSVYNTLDSVSTFEKEVFSKTQLFLPAQMPCQIISKAKTINFWNDFRQSV